MFLKSVHFDAQGAGGDVRDKIQHLVEQVKAEPNNEVPLLQLAHVYAQVWMRTGQKELIGHVVQCLKRAASLEKGQLVVQLRKLLIPITAKAREQKLSSAVGELESIAKDLDTRFPQEAESVMASESAPSSPESSVSPTPTSTAPSTEPETQTAEPTDSGPAISPDLDITTVEEEAIDPMAGVGEDINASIETAPEEAPAPEPEEPRQTSEEIIEEQKQENLIGQAKNKTRVLELFKQENLGEIIALYSQLDDRQTKCLVIDGLAKRLDTWKIEPLLAVAALESDSNVYRYFIRAVLKGDREMVGEQINLSSYSPDLQKVGVALLADLGGNTALKKLAGALEIDDPIVRSVALRGIGRHGKRASSYIPKLVEIAATDEIEGICEAAAKALNEMNNKSAYLELEKRGRKKKLPNIVYAELDLMRVKYDDDNEDVEAKDTGGEEKKEVSPEAQKQKMQGIALAVIVAIGAAYYFLVLKK